MKSEKNAGDKNKVSFDRPQFPFIQIITTFAIPLSMYVVPRLIDNTTSQKDLIIMALIAFSIMLFVLWFITYLGLYDEAFKRQSFMLQVEYLQGELEIIKDKIEFIHRDNDDIKPKE